jgi:ankyrin repeat protein
MLAAIQNQIELAKVLIEQGAEVNKPGWTPLHYAASKGHIEMMRLLIESSAYLDAESPNGTTPLMMAAYYGTPQSVKLLLEEGADPHLKNQLGLNALAFARQANKTDSALYIEAFEAAWLAKYPPKP